MATLAAHTSVLAHQALPSATQLASHTVVASFKTLSLETQLDAHISILVHQSGSDSNTGTDNSRQGQAKALKAALGYGWGVPDPKGSANEKIETPRESWPIERTSEAKRLMHDQGMDSATAEGVGEAMRKLGEDISHDVRTNLQRYEWHANTHSHPALGGDAGTPIGPAEAVFAAGGTLKRLRADSGQLVWSRDNGLPSSSSQGYQFLDVDFKNKKVYAASGFDEDEPVAAYTFEGEQLWRVFPFREVEGEDVVYDEYNGIVMSRDRQKLYMLYVNNDFNSVILYLDAENGDRTFLPAEESITAGNLIYATLDATEDYIYFIYERNFEGSHVRKHSVVDGSLLWDVNLDDPIPIDEVQNRGLLATDTLVWATVEYRAYILRPQSGVTISTYDLPGEEGCSHWVWKDHLNNDSVYVMTTKSSQPLLHRLWVTAETIEADEELWKDRDQSNDQHLVVRDADGNFLVANGFDEVIKLDPGLSPQWRANQASRNIQTEQGRSVHW